MDQAEGALRYDRPPISSSSSALEALEEASPDALTQDTSSLRSRFSIRANDQEQAHEHRRPQAPPPPPPRKYTLRPFLPRTISAPLTPRITNHTSPDIDEKVVAAAASSNSRRRGSTASVNQESFYNTFQSIQASKLAQEFRSPPYADSGHDRASVSQDSRSIDMPSVVGSFEQPTHNTSDMNDLNIAVIGAAGVGKSTLIQRALGLRTLPSGVASSLKMTVDGVLYTVSMIELDLESFHINAEKRINWPKQINGQIVPPMDAALILYDVMNEESVSELPQTLNALVNSSLPSILVACKCDNPPSTRQIDTVSMEAACLACVEALKTASNVPESARNCLTQMVRAIIARNSTQALARRRAASSANLDASSSVDRPLSQHSKHSRASSDLSLVKGFPAQPPTSSRSSGHMPASRTPLANQFMVPSHNGPPTSSHATFRNEDPAYQSIEVDGGSTGHEQLAKHLAAQSGRPTDAFLDMEAFDAASAYSHSDDVPLLQRSEDSFFDKSMKVVGVSFDELVDRLLDQNMSRADANFGDIFLCLYRKFAAPGELFTAILGRLESAAGDRNEHFLTRLATQLRIIAIIAHWVSSYPGDFANPSTSQRLDAFIDHLSVEPAFAAAAQEMRVQIQTHVTEDDDTGWARTDASLEVDSNGGSFRDDIHTTLSVKTHIKPLNDFTKSKSKSQMDDESIGGSSRHSAEGTSSTSVTGGGASRPSNPRFHTVEDYEREAATMIPRGIVPLTKNRYHMFMDTSDEDFADEMTRIDWVMFSAIRLRDLVRSVSLPLEQKEKCRSLTSVNRMAAHFNHIARWVSNMILMRDKAKHRAQMLDKFMRIALRLRQMNNYNGLGAVMAGIKGTAVHRLAQTFALVAPDTHKRFCGLELLMGNAKSHFAYRLAWENSPMPRIPYIPLHRRDLVSAEDGNQTFVGPQGDRINWKKFEILAEIILPIMKSQVTPYPNLTKHEMARELILDCRMPTDEEEIYQRSQQVESTNSNSFEIGKKKFPWFQK